MVIYFVRSKLHLEREKRQALAKAQKKTQLAYDLITKRDNVISRLSKQIEISQYAHLSEQVISEEYNELIRLIALYQKKIQEK